MSKRKQKIVSATRKNEPLQKKVRKSGSIELSAYFKSYKQGINDFHWPIFRATKEIVNPVKVLYPGCHRHITASLVFSTVVYIDNYSKIKNCFTDKRVLEWISQNKEYPGESNIKFICRNFEGNFGEKSGGFDLVMSLSAGIVTKSCSKYLKKGGYFLVSDAHFDARMLYLDPKYQLSHVWHDGKFDNSLETLEGHFITIDGHPITESMVQESVVKPKAKRSFKLQKESLFYLFKKIS